MSLFLSCDTKDMSLLQLLKALSVTHSDGSKGYRVVISDVADCGDLSGDDCGLNDVTGEQGFRERIVLDPCNKPAVLLFNTADAT